MRFLKITNLLMNCVPILFGISLYIYYYWSKSFHATHGIEARSYGLGVISRIAHWTLDATFFVFLPNLIFFIVLIGFSRVEKKSIKWNLATFAIGTVIMMYLFWIEPVGLLPWILD